MLLALWVSTSDRACDLAGRAVFILLWVGFMALFRGISDLVLAFELRRLGKAQPDEREEWGAVGAAQPITTKKGNSPGGLASDVTHPRP